MHPHRVIGASIVALALTLSLVATAVAAPNKLRIETGGDGAAYIFSSASARLTVGGPGSGYAAVYTTAKGPAGKRLIDIDMGFVVAGGSGQTGNVTGGAPRLTIPIDMDGDGAWDDFASIDWASCGGSVDSNGVLTADVFVSTTNPDCGVNLNAGGSFANWDAFAAANPTYRVAKGQQAFIIADWGPTDVNLSSIDLN